jgi:signal transduction histidine kinase
MEMVFKPFMSHCKPTDNDSSKNISCTNDSIEQLARLLDAVPFYVLLVDDRHRIVAWNLAMRDQFNVTDPCGAYCPKLIHGVDGIYPGCPLEQAIASNQAVEKEIYDQAEDRWIVSSVYPTALKTDSDRPLFLHFTRDITAEKRSAQALEMSLEHHKALSRLLQRLSVCQSPEQTLEELVQLTLGLSWMKATCGAGAFLIRDGELELVTEQSIGGEIARHCSRVALGECLCGTAALKGKAEFHSSLELNELHAQNSTPSDHGHAVIPLVFEGKSLGVVNFYLDSATTLTDGQRSFLEAATGVTAAALAQQVSRRQTQEARAKASYLERSLIEQVIAGQEEERKRVARELHDDLGQALSAMLLDVKTDDEEPPVNLEFCKKIEGAVRELISKVYQLAWDLRPSILDDYGLDSALSRHIGKVTERTHIPIDYEFICPEPLDPRLPPTVEVMLYRVAQEALNNVVRHAGASRVSVIVYRRADAVVLIVEDDGHGFDRDLAGKIGQRPGLGITGMRERVGLIKGDLVIESSVGEGTSVRATIPLLG